MADNNDIKTVFNEYTTNALAMRKARETVRYAGSLVANNGPIYEQPGENWMANMDTRTIYWRVTDPKPPFKAMCEDQMLMLTVHEASHINHSGGWITPDDIDRKRFHMFVNAIEDIRIERLAEKELPGFGPLRHKFNKESIEDIKETVKGLGVVERAGVAYLTLEENVSIDFLGDDIKKFCEDTWQEVSRIANATNTADLAEMLVPIYRALVDNEDANKSKEEKEKPDADDISGSKRDENGDVEKGCLSPNGGDSPTETPMISPRDKIKGRNSSNITDMDIIEQLLEMAKNAGDQKTVDEINKWIRQEEAKRRQAKEQAISMTGKGGLSAGTTPGQKALEAKGEDLWRMTKQQNIGAINVLRRKLETTLRNNASDDWETGLSRGQLDMGIAYKSLNGNSNIYRERNAVGAIDYTFGIIVDKSGSQMRRIKTIYEACVVVAEATEQAGISTFMLPWNNAPDEIKPLGDSYSKHAGRLTADILNSNGGTYETPALILSKDEFLRTRPGSKKVLITITDGETHKPNESIQLINELHELGVSCCAISIAHPHPPKYYEESHYIPDAQALMTLLPRIINQVVKKGRR